MGEVYLAEDTSLRRKVALKFLPTRLHQNQLAHKRFLREAVDVSKKFTFQKTSRSLTWLRGKHRETGGEGIMRPAVTQQLATTITIPWKARRLRWNSAHSDLRSFLLRYIATTLTLLVISVSLSVLNGQSTLIYPRLSFEAGIINGLAVVNPADTPATVTFTAYGIDGTPIQAEGFQNPTERVVGAGQQLSEIAAALFGSTVEDSLIAWIEASSTVSDLTGFFLVLNEDLTFFDGADLPGAYDEIVFQDIRIDDGFSTELNIINPGTEPVVVTLQLVQATGRSERELEIPARGPVRLDAAGLFEAQAAGDGPGAAYIVVSSTSPIAGFAFVRGPGDAFGSNAQPASELLNRLYFPQLAVLDPFITELSVINSAEQVAILTITAHRPDGTLYGGGDLQTNPVVRALEGGAILHEDVEELFGFSGDTTLEGWLEIESTSQSIHGSISYSIPSMNSIAAVASVARGNQRAVFSHIATTLGFFTGVAILNPGSLTANVRVVAVEPDGTVIGRFSTVLRPGRRISQLITEMIPQTDGRGGGLIWVSSDIPVYLTSLFGSVQSGVLANIPPQSVPENYRPVSGPEVRLAPPLAVLSPGGEQRFSLQGATQGMDWSVNDIPGGNATVGTINQNGSFAAPGLVPMPLPVTVTVQVETQIAGASVDVLQSNTFLTELGIIQSVAYLEGLDRLFVAELILPPSLQATQTSPAQEEMSLISDVSSGMAKPIISLDDDISKMVAFRGIDDVEYLLLAGRSSGTIRRLDLSTMRTVVVARDLDAPASMVIDPLTGSLLVAEATEVTVIPESKLNLLLAPAPATTGGAPSGKARRALGGIVPRGVAVDSCTGEIFISDAATRSIVSYDRLTGQRTTVLEDLANPGGLLGLIREGVPCPSAFHLFIVEEGTGSVTLMIPSSGTVTNWAEINGIRDLTFVPQGSAIVGAEGIGSGNEAGTIAFRAVPDLYASQAPNPEVTPGPTQCVGTVTFADANLESAVRAALDLAQSAPLTCGLTATLSSLVALALEIVNLDGIESLTQLKELNLAENEILDINALRGLKQLTYLDLRDNQISDITAVGGLTQLTLLSLPFNQVTDISAVASLTELESLFLGVNQIDDISPVADLKRLTLLGLGRNPINDDDLVVLSRLTELRTLGLTGNRLTDLDPLSDLTQLTKLLLGGNRIIDISSLAGLTQLTELELPFNRITDISPLTGLAQLTDVWLESNQISSIAALTNLTQLNTLNLDTNEIRSINSLVLNPGLGSGDFISLRNNLLGLGDCPNIQTLIDRGATVTHDVACP